METKTEIKENKEIIDNNNEIEVYNKENVLKDKEKPKKKIIIITIIIILLLFITIFLSVYLTKGKKEENKEIASNQDNEEDINEKCNLLKNRKL